MDESINLNRVAPRDGYIQILNYGGFRAKFGVQYTLNGQAVNKYSGVFLVGQTRKIDIPKNATNIYLLVNIDYFIETWGPLYNNFFKTPEQVCYVLYGVTVAPFCKQIPCESPNDPVPPEDNNQCCCCCCCCKKPNS